MKPLPKWGMILVTASSVALYIGLAAWGWGGWGPFVAHPARAAAVAATVVISIAAMFTRGNLSSGRREDASNRWILLPFLVLGIVLGWLPAYTDRREIATIDGDAVRYVGLALYIVGCVVRLAPVFVLGRRFSGLVAIQEDHELVTGGLYRVIRHPSYLGLLIMSLGWSLAFQSDAGIVLTAILLVPLVARIQAEEALLRSHFGAEYDRYRDRTSRLIPGLY